ncbi:MAG TPA: AsmA family protein [Acetobacteraceae bacterium]|nr:AsmA family protein [Acetobacteraceae bacterium]
MSRTFRILGFVLAAVIVLAVAAVAVLPSVLDWNRYRGTLEMMASDALGRPVTIAGPVSLSLLPQPMLTASRVRVGGGGDGARIVVAELRLRVALMPLLSGQVDARELTLRQPNLRLPWPPRLGVPLATPPWLAALSARIEDGEIEAGGLTLTHVNATLAEGRGDAALVFSGSAAMGQNNWLLDLRLGYPDPDGSAPIKATLTGADAADGANAKLTGRLEPDGRISGLLVFAGPSLARLMAAPSMPFRAESTVEMGGDAIRFDRLALTLGGMRATGGGTLALAPALRLNLALTSRDAVPLDPWLSVLRGGGESLLPVGLTLAAPRATLARALIREVRLAAVFAPGGARIGAFEAILPGDAHFAAEGQLAQTEGKTPAWQFTGTAHLDAPALTTTAHWLDAAAPGVLPRFSPRVLGAADLGARVTIDEARIALEDISGVFDQSHVGGGLSLGLGGMPAISAGLTLDKLDLDPWLPEGPEGTIPTLAAVPRLFAGMSVELRLSVGQASLGGTAINALTLDAAGGNGQVIVRRLDATVRGVRGIASGTLGAGGLVTAGQLALTAPGTATLAELLPAPLGAAIRRWKVPVSLTATAAGPPKALRLTLEGTLGDLRLTAAPTIDLASGDWQGLITLRHPGAAEMITVSGFADPGWWLGQGSFSLIGNAVGRRDAWSLSDFRVIAGSLTASGNLGLASEPDGPAISGDVRASVLPVPVPVPGDREPLPLVLLAGWRGDVRFAAGKVLDGPRVVMRDAVGRVSAADGALTMEATGSPPGGGTMTAVLGIDTKAGPPQVRLGAAFGGVHLGDALFRASLDIRAGTLSGQIGLAGEGYSPSALLATMRGSASLTASDGVVSGIDLGGVRAALAESGPGSETKAASMIGKALAGGETRFARLSLEAAGSAGRFALRSGTLSGPGGTIAASGSVDLPASTEDLRLGLIAAEASAPEVVVRLAGPIARPARLTEASAALHWLAEKSQAKPAH